MNSDDEDEWAALGFEAPGAVHQEVVQCTRHRALLPIPASSDESEDDASAATASTAAAVAAAAASKVCDANSESDDDEDDDAGDNGREEGMEEVCFLQVPNDVAEKLNRMLRLQGASSSSSSSSTSPTSVQVMFDETPGDGPQHARLRVADLELPGRLCNLPTIVEVHKSFDPKCGTYHKANQAGQMIVVDHDEAVLPTERELPNGLSAPTARIRRRKWRRKRPAAHTAADVAHLEEELWCLAKHRPVPDKRELVWEDVYEDVPEGEEEGARV